MYHSEIFFWDHGGDIYDLTQSHRRGKCRMIILAGRPFFWLKGDARQQFTLAVPKIASETANVDVFAGSVFGLFELDSAHRFLCWNWMSGSKPNRAPAKFGIFGCSFVYGKRISRKNEPPEKPSWIATKCFLISSSTCSRNAISLAGLKAQVTANQPKNQIFRCFVP